METQDQSKTNSSGNGSHGVHVCHKCNWPFPNAHPSAKQRRAHKRICGTVEGNKPALSVVVDEQHSDEDHKSPTVESPNVVESTSSSKTVTEHGGFSTRLDEEVFSDATNDFSESSFGDGGRIDTANKSGILVDKVAEKDLSPAQSFKDCSDTDLVEAPKNTNELSQIQPLAQTLPQPSTACQDLVLNSSDNSFGMLLTCEKTGPESDTTHIDSEKQNCTSDESEKYTIENMERVPASRNDEVTSEKHPDDDVRLDEHVDRTLETTLEFERNTDPNLDILVGDDGIQLKHEYYGESAHSMPIGEVVEKEAHQKRKEEIVSDSGLENVMDVTCEPAETMQECDGESASGMPVSEAVEKEAHRKGDKEIVSDGSLENVMDVTSVHSETRQDHADESASSMAIGEVFDKRAHHEGKEVLDIGLHNVIDVASEYASESASSMPTSEVTVKEAHHEGDKIVSASGLENVMELTSEHADIRQEGAGESTSKIPTGEPILEKAPRMGDNEIFPRSKLENVMIVSGEHSETKSEVTLKSKKRKELTLYNENAGETVQSEEVSSNTSASRKTGNSVLTHAESVEYQTDIVDTVWEKLDVAAQAELAQDRKDEGDESVHVLAVPTDIPAIENEETMLEGFKDHKRMRFQRSVFMYSGEELKGDMHEMKDLPKETPVIPSEIDDFTPKEAASSVQSTEFSGQGNLLTEEVPTEKKTTIQINEGLYKADREGVQETYALADSLQDINCSEKEMIDHFTNFEADHHDRSVRNIHEVALSDNHERAREENNISSSLVPSESGRTEAGDNVHGKTEKGDIDENGSEEPLVGDLSGGTNPTSKSVSSHQEAQISMEGKDDEDAEILTNSQSMNLDKVCDFDEEVENYKQNKDLEEQRDRVDESFSTPPKTPEGEGSVVPKTSVDSLKKESLDSHTEADLHASNLPLADGTPNKNFFEFYDSFVKHQLDSSATEFSVESGSQADSLEANPGSVSVLSNLSDIPAATETGVLKSTNLQPPEELEGAKLQNQEDASWVHHTDKSEEFEPPSFMTLVEPGTGNQKSATSKIQTPETPPQLDPAQLRAGWFPSITSVANESPGRKRNEEIIAKVTNWNMNQEHTPLKNLLGKASAQAKASSPNRKENQPLLAREPLFDEPGTAEAAKEWNSPARYPDDIKRERRKAKGRPYWAQFVCCSSVH